MNTYNNREAQRYLLHTVHGELRDYLPKVHVHSSLGFLTLQQDVDAIPGHVNIVGFGTPLTWCHDTASQEVQPTTQLEGVPENLRTIDLQGKGVGPRLYNSPEAYMGLKHPAETIGVFSSTLERKRILDLRQKSGGALTRIATHASRMVRSARTSLEEVVDEIHSYYGDAQAVLMTQPPQPALRQMIRGHRPPSFLGSEFMIIRDPAVRLKQIGTVATKNL